MNFISFSQQFRLMVIGLLSGVFFLFQPASVFAQTAPNCLDLTQTCNVACNVNINASATDKETAIAECETDFWERNKLLFYCPSAIASGDLDLDALRNCLEERFTLQRLCIQAHPDKRISDKGAPLSLGSRLARYETCIQTREDNFRAARPEFSNKDISTFSGELQSTITAIKNSESYKEQTQKIQEAKKFMSMAQTGEKNAKANSKGGNKFAYDPPEDYSTAFDTPDTSQTFRTAADWAQEAFKWENEIQKLEKQQTDSFLVGGKNILQEQRYVAQKIANEQQEIQLLKQQMFTDTTASFDISDISIGAERTYVITEDYENVENNLIARITRLLITIIGTLGVLLLVIGGVMLITADGDSTQIGNAKNVIVYTIVGVAIAFLSFIIVQFVLGILFQ